ncbi:MAG: hypothetical protein JXR64_04825 [Spirochaetales bacterium]|nr:hypothetical protein [Spirochaetales bacterium]
MNRDLLRGESIYSVFIRNHSETGDIKGLILDLERIKSLGVTILWILPHYPIGEKNKKGELGNSYSISDYYSVNPDIGGINDFKMLVSECHKLELKLVIDIVFNHTSWDSVLVNENPDWFIRDNNNNFIGKIPHWDDVIDLDFKKAPLKKYLIDVLAYWAGLGVDGFRCDLASIVPLGFWKMAKDSLNKDYPDLIWFGESVEKEFISFIRHNGFDCHSDSELFTVFDLLYDYDVQVTFEGYINGIVSFDEFVKERRNQEVIYPIDYMKLRFLENNDSKTRIAAVVSDKYRLKNLKAFSMFEKGVPLIYAGEEYGIVELPDLYNSSKIDWTLKDVEYCSFIRKILSIDHMYIVTNGIYTINPLTEDCVHLRYRYNGETLHGIFNFGKKDRIIELEVLEGNYLNLITGEEFNISKETLNLNNAPFIFKSIP